MRFNSSIGRLTLGAWIVAGMMTGSAGYSAAGQARALQARPTEPRIKPIEPKDWTDTQKAALAPAGQNGQAINLYKTCAIHPKLCAAWMPLLRHALNERGGSTLPPRDREIIILRIAWLRQSPYEWGHHDRIGRSAGLTDADIKRVPEGLGTKGWSAFDAVLLKGVEELLQNAFITDDTWQALAKRYNEQQLMDFVFTVGQYDLLAMALNSFGVQLEPNLATFPR